jgi:hypothetical protein
MRILHPFGHEKKRNDEKPYRQKQTDIEEQNAWKKPPPQTSLTPVNRWSSLSE